MDSQSSTSSTTIILVVVGILVVIGGIVGLVVYLNQVDTPSTPTTPPTTTTPTNPTTSTTPTNPTTPSTPTTPSCPECKEANTANCASFCPECKECVEVNAQTCAPFITQTTCATVPPSTAWIQKIINKECGTYVDVGDSITTSRPFTPCQQLSNGQFVMLNQLDGNIAIYNTNNRTLPVFNFYAVQRRDIVQAPYNDMLQTRYNTMVFQANGNLEIQTPAGIVLWSSNTTNQAAGGKCFLHSTGALVVTTGNNVVVWSSNPGAVAVGTTVSPPGNALLRWLGF